MVRTGGRVRLCVLGVVLAAACGCSVALAATPAPHGGGWKMRPYTYGGQPGKPGLDEMTGSFRVGGGAVSDVRGVTGRQNHSGCTPGVQIQSIGKAPIKHMSDSAGTYDFWWVGTGTELWEKLRFKLTPPGGKHSAVVAGQIRIYFPGGVGDYFQGFGSGNIQVGGAAVGVLCNMNFDLK